MFPMWLQILPFLHLLLLRRPASQLVLHRCVWSPVSIPARPPTLPASQLLAGPQLPLTQRGVQRPFLLVDSSRPLSVWHLRSDTHNQCTQVYFNHRALDASDASHTMSAPIPERHVGQHMAFPLGFRWCARPRQQPDTFSVLSGITLAIHVRLFLCMWSEFAFLLGILHSSKIKFNHFALSSQAFTSHGSSGLSFICYADSCTQVCQ